MTRGGPNASAQEQEHDLSDRISSRRLQRQHLQNLVDVEKTGARSEKPEARIWWRLRRGTLTFRLPRLLTPAAPEGPLVRAESRTSLDS